MSQDPNMQDPSNGQPEEEEYKRERKKVNRENDEGSLTMNSLMDILTIILVFLLLNVGDQPIKAVGADFKVPDSSSQLLPQDMTAITVTRRSILVNDHKAVDVKNGAVDKSQKKGGEAGMIIQPLFDQLTQATKHKKREMKLLGQPYQPVATIIADESTPYRLITEVMYTAGQAALNKFKFAVIRKSRPSLFQ